MLLRYFSKINLIRKNVGFLLPPASMQKRSLSLWFTWLNRIFNSVDKKRLKLLGADLTCAEWILRNGATLRFKGHDSLITDYNDLMILEELEESSLYRVEEIYAENSGLSHYGFDHLQGCDHVRKITFILCRRIDDRCLHKLEYVEKSLQYLKIKSCFEVTDSGLQALSRLKFKSLLIPILQLRMSHKLWMFNRHNDNELTITQNMSNCWTLKFPFILLKFEYSDFDQFALCETERRVPS